MIEVEPGRRAVWCSAHHWDSAIQVSAHQHARELASRGWDVLFLSTPVTPFHAAAVHRSADHRARFRAWHRRGHRSEGVVAYTPLTIAPLSMVVGLKYEVVLRRWQQATVPPLGRALTRLGFDAPDLLVVDTPLYRFLLDDLRPVRSAYRVTDFNRGFLSATTQLEQLEREAVGAADVTLFTAPELEEHVVALGARERALVPHGVDVKRFSSPVAAPPEYERIPGPRAVYVGSLREWFDFDLLGRTARALPGVSFVVVGPEHWARRHLPVAPNIHVLGERAHSLVPAYLQHADVGIIPFDRDARPELVDAINPLKLYEYAAAGLPVVSTDWAAVRRLASPARLAADADDFASKVGEAIGDRSATDAGRRWVADHTWSARADGLLEVLGLSR